MMGRRQRVHSPSEVEPAGDGGPGEAAAFVAENVVELALLARRHGLETLAFLLDMAKLEADELVRAGVLQSLR